MLTAPIINRLQQRCRLSVILLVDRLPADQRDIWDTVEEHSCLRCFAVSLARRVIVDSLSAHHYSLGVVTGRLPVRRRLQIYLPAFLMALMMQIIAPIGASWSAASSLSDPLAAFGGVAICHTAGGEGDNQSDQTGHHGDGACAVCCLVHAGASLDTPKIPVCVPYRPSLPVVWQNVAQELLDSRSSGHAQARAPPSNS